MKRDALRDQILRALANPPPGSPANAAPGGGGAETRRAPSPPGELRDRIGGRDALLGALNRDFMPLAHECISEAQRRNPRLAGLLAIGLETAADKELGAVVEAADPTARSRIEDPELLECIRESALSLRLPPPPASGREKFELTLPIEPDEAKGDGREEDEARRRGDGGPAAP